MTLINKSISGGLATAIILLMSLPSRADPLNDYVQTAVLKNPEVLQRWHTFKAAGDEASVARSAYLPRLDLTAGGGVEAYSSETSGNSTMGRSSFGLTLTQLLYDGGATKSDINRLDHVKLTRYYELLEATEGAALETIRSYFDVMRNRELYELTQTNFVYHRTVYEQIQNKVKAGVGRRVDLEQAQGRLSLSETNLVADAANLHDVTARFQRVVGELPKKELTKSDPFSKLLHANSADAHLAVALENSPSVLSAIENVRQAKMDVDVRNSNFRPRVDFRLSQNEFKNYSGVRGHDRDTVAEVVLNWNLFNGGADTRQVSQYSQKLNAARDDRDRVCRDIRQNMVIAYNDIWKLKEQLTYISQHQISIEKAKLAYQKQFEIGQRTLLDLLDTENELYSARRSYVNAEYDLLIANARTLAGMGRLTDALGMTRLAVSDLPEMLGTKSDGPETCRPEAPIMPGVSKEELVRRAIEAAKPSPNPVAPGAPSATVRP